MLALALADQSNMVVSHVSLPADQTDRLQTFLPELLSSFKINRMTLDGTALRYLMQELEFPTES